MDSSRDTPPSAEANFVRFSSYFFLNMDSLLPRRSDDNFILYLGDGFGDCLSDILGDGFGLGTSELFLDLLLLLSSHCIPTSFISFSSSFSVYIS